MSSISSSRWQQRSLRATVQDQWRISAQAGITGQLEKRDETIAKLRKLIWEHKGFYDNAEKSIRAK